jgi:hypothetical protein
MKDQVVMLLMGIVLALGGWNLTQTFNLSTGQVVAQEKVDKLESQVMKLIDQIDDMKDLDEDIVEQHERFIRLLENNTQPSTSSSSYSY